MTFVGLGDNKAQGQGFVPYCEKYSVERRKKMCVDVLKKHPDRIPVIVDKDPNNGTLPLLTHNKYLTPQTLKFGEFAYVIRKYLKLNQHSSLILCVVNERGTHFPCMTALMSNVHNEYKDETGFLTIVYMEENTFG
jgi:GABA(A) receptor-associated protein